VKPLEEYYIVVHSGKMLLLVQMLAPSAQRTEKMKRSSLGLGWAVSVACSLMLLSGCDKLKAVDDLMAQTASNTAEIDSLKRSLADSRKETDALRSQVIGMYDRVAAVETVQATQATKAPSVPPSPTALGPQEIATLKAAIEACVQVGRAVPPPQYSDGSMTKGFDAYYNPISGRVQNNVRYQGEMPALYAFNKCMVGKGISLG
jgi:uncharacterized coiled-coil protein SlyX